MHSLNVLIIEEQPAQVLQLHQALNACGVFNVRVAERATAIAHVLAGDWPVDIALLDSRGDGAQVSALVDHRPHASLILRGEGKARALELQARQEGLRVLGHLPWRPATHPLHAMLEHYRQTRTAF
ncbi:hypothetical protein [Pseudomonas sp. KNUC1026]|uniref:hypothetical protein n=1 Tax=Pseudomonas sp. KNUC1026 TaxID=2893890 RepID=UPI001F2FC129|nr:hypothetical protein [Pseudomonas sp. KNUC1026]UFH48594.1 hypothetical protein LN139_16160 [Pseudomonas sp. KNUC1026]